MKRSAGTMCVLLVVVGVLLTTAPAAQRESAPAAPTSGWRFEFYRELTYFEGRFTSIAQAFPPEKYSWSPGPGVRSVSQVLLHISQRNFIQPTFIGTPPPPDLRTRDFGFSIGGEADPSDIEKFVRTMTGDGIMETTTNDKAKVQATLKDSFAHFRAAWLKLSEQDADKPVRWLGDNTYRGVGYFWARHMGEHLGQLIAYARVNGIVPPWTAAAQERERLRKQEGGGKP